MQKKDSGLELIKSVPDFMKSTRYRRKYSDIKYGTRLTFNEELLRRMWYVMSNVYDFGLNINAEMILKRFFDRIDPVEWIPSSVAPNITPVVGLDIKLLTYIMYRWVNGDFASKKEVEEAVRFNGKHLFDSLDSNPAIKYKLFDRAKDMRAGLLDWFTTPYDELKAMDLPPEKLRVQYSRQKLYLKDDVADSLSSLRNELALDEIHMETLKLADKIESDYTVPETLLEDLYNKVEELSTKYAGIETNEAVDMIIDFNSKKLDQTLQEAEERLQMSKPYSTGSQGINGMLQGGTRRGEYVNISALSHQYKSGLTTTITVGTCIANDWDAIVKEDLKKLDPKGDYSTLTPENQGALVVISLEDNLENFYRNAYEVLWASGFTTHFPLTIGRMSIDDGMTIKERMNNLPFQLVVKDVTRALQSRGLRLVTVKGDPTKWTVHGLLSTAEALMADGINIRYLVVDYLDMLPDSNLGDNGIAGEAKKQKVQLAKNWCLKRGITFLSPWQLSSSASTALASGMDIEDFMHYIANTGFYSGCKTLTQSLDASIMCHTYMDKELGKLLLVVRSKHRGLGDVDERKKLVIYRFLDGLKPGLDALGGRHAMHKHTIGEFINDMSSGGSTDSGDDINF